MRSRASLTARRAPSIRVSTTPGAWCRPTLSVTPSTGRTRHSPKRGKAMKTITCSQLDELKEAYADGALSPELHAAVDAHVAACAQCARRLAVARGLAAGI